MMGTLRDGHERAVIVVRTRGVTRRGRATGGWGEVGGMSAEPLPGDGPADPAPAPFRPSPTVRPGPRRLTPVRSVPPPPTTPMVRPGRHAAPDPVDGPAPSVAPPAPAPPAPAPPTPEADAARRVREAWEEVGPQVDELADWFAALLFSLDPGSRALFPARVTEPA